MSADTVRGVAEAALGWASGRRLEFRLDDTALDAATDVNRTWKPLGELALACVAVRDRTRPGENLHELACDLLAFAWEQTRRGERFLDLQRLEPWATYPLEVYAPFSSAGLRHPGYEEFLRAVVPTRSWRRTEQLPNRRLAIRNAERRGGQPPSDAASEPLGRTWLGGLPEPWAFERMAGYTATHVVFHLTDWGTDTGGVPPKLAAYLETWLPAWLDTCLDDDHWDLACELLAVAASLPQPPPRAPAEQAWARVAEAQDADGAIPEMGPGRRGRPVVRDFINCYHSTLMAAFAAVLTLARLTEGQGAPA
ncbi:DUF6895 family protein [Streptomyces sp. HMX112]|uniref:DUF6895 family protein n=1 Tax=Streptomyces sp. HMX112 TaxID=3390850 RepID=UPI003A7FB5A0